MFVRDRMTPNPISIDEDVSVLEALDIMRRHQVRRLPILRQGRLVGIVTEMDLMRVSPSPATSLSIFEMNYLLTKMKVKQVMAKEVVTVSPDTTIEEAAILMREHAIAGLPVLENGRLVGIVTETNLFDAFVDMMGLRRPGSRLTVEVEDRPGQLAEITRLISEAGVNIIGIASLPPDQVGSVPSQPGQNLNSPTHGRGQLVLRLATTDPDPLVRQLQQHGFPVVHVVVQAG